MILQSCDNSYKEDPQLVVALNLSSRLFFKGSMAHSTSFLSFYLCSTKKFLDYRDSIYIAILVVLFGLVKVMPLHVM